MFIFYFSIFKTDREVLINMLEFYFIMLFLKIHSIQNWSVLKSNETTFKLPCWYAEPDHVFCQYCPGLFHRSYIDKI